MSGCASNRDVIVRDLCLIAEPLYFNDEAISAMTLSEAERVADHNENWLFLCEEFE